MPKYFHITYTGIYEGTFEDFIDKTDKVDDAMDEQFGDEWVGGANGDYDIEREFAHIIRCKDCKYAKEIPHVKEWDYSCRYFNTHSVMADDFCSRAEREEHEAD